MTKYQTVVDWIENKIGSGDFDYGVKLPSENQLCGQFGVSRNTVRKALEALEKNGVIERKQGSGSFVKYIEPPLWKSSPAGDLQAGKGLDTIGIIINYADNYIFPSIISGISNRLMDYGYYANLYVTQGRKDNETRILETILANHNLKGLIIDPTKSALPNYNAALLKEVAERIPCLYINHYYPGTNIPHITPDNAASMQMGTEYLIEKGHQAIGAICKSDDWNGILRYQGYLQALRKHNIIPRDDFISWYTTEQVPYIFEGSNGECILNIAKECTAITCYNDEIATMLIEFLEKHGLRVPEDISILGFDNSLLTEIRYPITSMEHPQERVGRLAAESMIRLIADPKADVNYEFEPVMIERTSVRDLTAKEP